MEEEPVFLFDVQRIVTVGKDGWGGGLPEEVDEGFVGFQGFDPL